MMQRSQSMLWAALIMALNIAGAIAHSELETTCKHGATGQRIEACTFLIEVAVAEGKRSDHLKHSRAHAFLLAKRYSEALDDANAVLSIEPWRAHALMDRAQAFAAIGDAEKATRDAGNALALRPDRADYWLFRGNLYLQSGRFDNAIHDYTECLGRQPQSGLAYMNRAIAFGRKGDVANGLDDANQAVILLPENADAYLNRGLLKYMAQKWDEAVHDFDSALRRSPNSPHLRWLRGIAASLGQQQPRSPRR